MIDHDLVFDNASTNKTKMNHFTTMLCGNFVGIDKLERLKLLQSDPLINEFDISIKESETASRFLGNFSYKTHPHAARNQFQDLQKVAEKEQAQSHTISSSQYGEVGKSIGEDASEANKPM